MALPVTEVKRKLMKGVRRISLPVTDRVFLARTLVPYSVGSNQRMPQ